MRKLGLSFLLAFVLTGCAQTPPLALENVIDPVTDEITQQNKCEFVSETIPVRRVEQGKFRSAVEGVPGDMLFLSGGSQNGAFGAGYLSGWSDPDENVASMPTFSLVTGISTGALQATGAFINDPDLGIEGYSIDDESEILTSYVPGRRDDGKLGVQSILIALKNGAIADLDQLRVHLSGILDHDVFEAVAARYAEVAPNGNRPLLLVGATDVDLGQAVAFDMTEMATRIVGAADAATRLHFKNCYIEALVASSIVPPGAQPVFIDNRMYIDGGVRFAVFNDRIRADLDSATNATQSAPPDAPVENAEYKLANDKDRRDLFPFLGPPASVPPEADERERKTRTHSPETELTKPTLYIILNGDGEIDVRCWRVNVPENEDCNAETSTEGQHKNWSLMSLAFRTLDIFTNQVEQLSIERIAASGAANGNQVRHIRIDSGDLNTRTFTLSDFPEAGSNTCEQWRALDDEIENPFQFHRRFMRCLIEYGSDLGRRGEWLSPPKTQTSGAAAD